MTSVIKYPIAEEEKVLDLAQKIKHRGVHGG
jgi:hypothetical protein